VVGDQNLDHIVGDELKLLFCDVIVRTQGIATSPAAPNCVGIRILTKINMITACPTVLRVFPDKNRFSDWFLIKIHNF
jgi:hypothetical protein